MVLDKTFTTLITTQQCLDGLKEWKRLSRNEDSDQKRDLTHNVRASNVNLEERIAAAEGYYSHSQIL